MNFTQVDQYWWSGKSKQDNSVFWIRLSAQNVGNDIHPRWIPRFIGWRVGDPILYWFKTLEECKREIENKYKEI